MLVLIVTSFCNCFYRYLLHPLLMMVIYESSPNGDYYYDLLGVAFYCFNTVIGLLCAATVFFLIELPAANVKSLVMPVICGNMAKVCKGAVTV